VNLTPERWQQVARIYELAVDMSASARGAFLSEACAGDEALRREVESLLQQDDESVVIDRSVWATAAPLFQNGSELEPGARLGPYRIDAPLGAGGMGEVFRATDTRLNRPVAIKILPAAVARDQQMRARFGREARAVAALTHPHICTLYDVGRQAELDFLVMEYLDGETLAARLTAGRQSLEQALEQALEIASALEHAHRHGIVHRDLKPANIMLTGGGVKLLDFGLAKFKPGGSVPRPDDQTQAETVTASRAGDVASGGHHEPADTQETRHGMILGTARYMAPEQIAGGDVDARSDLFSFGAVLHEMITGRSAFDGEDATAIRTAIFETEPPPVSSLAPSATPVLDDIVRRCLAKDPDARWQTAGDVTTELKKVLDSVRERTDTPPHAVTARLARAAAGILAVAVVGLALWLAAGGSGLWRSPTPAQIRSLAVLPLDNLSADPDQEFFADGMTEQLIADLAKVRDLRVTSRTSVMHYRGARKPAPEIARELQVGGIVEGSFAREGDTVRVTARLIDGGTGDIVWAETFERHVRDVLALQGEVARTIAGKIHIALSPQEQARIGTARPVDPEVHRQVLLARHHAGKSTEAGLRTGIQFYEAAIAADPSNALAHAGLSEAYSGLSSFYAHPLETMPKAKRAAETAVRLDSSLADAHAAMAYVQFVYDWDGPAAEQSFLRALDLNPTLAAARLNYAGYLTSQDRNDEAVVEIRRAVRLDPLSIRTHAFGTLFLLFCRRYDEAIELANRGLQLDPNHAFTLTFQGVGYAELGRYDEAVAKLERAAGLDQSPTILAMQAHVLAVAGRTEESRTLVRRVEETIRNRYFCPYEIGTVYVSLGDRDTAYEWFRKGTQDRADCMPWLGVEPWIDPFRTDPRYARLLREIGLTPETR
jgi:serine/threonine-protein kinase